MLSEEIYRENILDHFKHPHNHGKLDKNTNYRKEYNPSCGDTIEIFLVVEKDTIKDVKFVGKGCAISQASASMLTDKIKGKKVDEVVKFTSEDILDMLKIPISAVRMKCAMLSLRTIQRAVEKKGDSNVKN